MLGLEIIGQDNEKRKRKMKKTLKNKRYKRNKRLRRKPTTEEIKRVLRYLDMYWADTTTIHYCYSIYKEAK
jgi:hypothetical protein